MRNSPFAYAPHQHHPDSILSNVNNNNSNSLGATVDKMREVSMETRRSVEDSVEGSSDSRGSGDTDLEKKNQFGSLTKQSSVPPQHLINFQSVNSFVTRVGHYGTPRWSGSSPPGFPSSVSSFPARHFSWCKPAPPCLPSVGEEETEKPRASPCIMEEAQSPIDDASNPITDFSPQSPPVTQGLNHNNPGESPATIYHILPGAPSNESELFCNNGEPPGLTHNNGGYHGFVLPRCSSDLSLDRSGLVRSSKAIFNSTVHLPVSMPTNDIICEIRKTLDACARSVQYEFESRLKLALRRSSLYLEMEVGSKLLASKHSPRAFVFLFGEFLKSLSVVLLRR